MSDIRLNKISIVFNIGMLHTNNNIRLTLSLTEKQKNNSVAVQSCPFSVCVNTDYVFHSFIFAVFMFIVIFHLFQVFDKSRTCSSVLSTPSQKR